MSNEMNDNDSDIENDIHPVNENTENQNQNPAEFFKVTPDDYTDSDSNTIIDFDSDEEEQKKQTKEEKDENEVLDKESLNGEEEEDKPSEGEKKSENLKKKENEEQRLKTESKQEEVREDNQAVEPNENGEEQEEEQGGEHEENEDEDNGVTDPNVKKLMKIDLTDKEGIIDLLMKDNLVKKSEVKIEKIIKKQNMAKFDHVEPRVGKSEFGNMKTSYGRKGFQIEQVEGNPEFIKDMTIAASVVKDQIEKENTDVAKILFDEKIGKKATKRITREQIDEKVKKTLEKKKKNLEKIEAQIYEKQKANETFTPVINHRKGEITERRNLNKFLRDQKNFTNKLKKKREDIINEKNEKTRLTYSGKPQVDKNSEELAKKLNTTEQPAYLRLYNKRTLESEKKAEKEKLYKERKRAEAQKRKEKLMENNKHYTHIQSKIDMGQKKEEKILDKFGNIEKVKKENKEEKELQKQKEKILQKKFKKTKNKLLEIKEIPTYKMLYKNFIKRFDEAIESLENNNESLKEEEIHNLFYTIGMVSNPNKDINDENKEKIESEISNKESPIQLEENKLINICIASLKNEQNQINKEDIKNFLLCVVGLQKYFFYHTYKSKHEKEIEEEFKCKKEDLPELIIKKMNEEILSKVDKNSEKNNKYCYRTNDGKIYISLEKGHSLKKDFNFFALNYRNSKKPARDINTLMQERRQFDFKPVINENTNKYYEKYHDKITSMQKNNENETDDNNNQPKEKEKKKDNNKDNDNKEDPHMKYIEKILLHDKKRVYEIQKAKEELEKKELQECTFKPKINPEYVSDKTKKNNLKENKNEIKKNRMVELYEKGTADIKKRKNKTREEMEVESQIKECTFQPKKISEVIPEDKFKNDIYKEKQYKKLYERLKFGRMERLVKDSANDRYDLNSDLKKFVKKSKANKNIDYTEEEKASEEFIESSHNTNIIRNSKTSKKEKYESNIKTNSSNKNEEENYNNSISSEEDQMKKEGIPLLIIDVNIRQGVKKKIYVYEGDTPEGLAEKFALEHNLEEETKNKLQNLIHNHMVRLLTRIEEENQSISEKTQTTHNNLK